MICIREATTQDLLAMARLESSRDPGAKPVSAADLGEEWRAFPQGGLLRLMLAVDDAGPSGGETGAVGLSRVSRLPWWGPGRFVVDVIVDPARRGQGIGTRLFAEAEAFAREQGAARLDVNVREGDAASYGFAEKHGCHPDRHLFSSVLDLDQFDPAPFLPVLEQVTGAGIRIVSLADLPDTEPNRRKFYELHRTCTLGIPGREQTFASYEMWVARNLKAESFRREAQFIALDGDRWVGFVLLEPRGKDGLWHRMTGVDPAYRGRSIALALKLTAIQYGLRTGCRQMATNNDAENAPMLAVNRKLGYRPEPGLYFLQKRLD